MTASEPTPRFSVIDLGSEAVAGLFARPGRTFLTVLGTVIGVGALVATLGLSRTAANRIVGRFDELAATEIQVTSRPATLDGASPDLPWDGPDRVTFLNGVIAAGTSSGVDVGEVLVATSPVSDPQHQTEFRLSVQALSPGMYDVIHATVQSGRLPDEGHSKRRDRVAVLGASAAERLGIVSVERMPAIAIGDVVFTVIGIVDGVQRQHELLASVMIPEGAAREIWRLRVPELLIIETRVGAADVIAQQAALALRPDAPETLKVAAPSEPRRVRDAVEGDLDVLFLVLGAVSLLVGAIGIANVTLVSVIERTGEIGLRRALGARQGQIGAQFLLESGLMGLAGGLIGTSVGILVVVIVAAAQSWTPVLDPAIPLVAPVLGAVTGLIAGAYPSVRAARLEPVDALRSAH